MKAVRVSMIALSVALLPLAACHKAPEPPVENATDDTNATEEPSALENNVVEEAAPAENNMMEEAPKPKAPPVKPWPKVSADQQMLDDADATGMTSRVSRDGSDATNQN